MGSIQQSITTKKYSLLDLPPEIRHIIYDYLFSTTTIFPRVRGNINQTGWIHPIVNFFLTSREVYQEIKPYFWRRCVFDLSVQFTSNRLRWGTAALQVDANERGFVTAEHLFEMRRIYCTMAFARCLDMLSKYDMPWTQNMFPGLHKDKMHIEEMTIEVPVGMAFDTIRNEWVLKRRSIPSLLSLRAIQKQDLPYQLYLRLVDQIAGRVYEEDKPMWKTFLLDVHDNVSDTKNMKQKEAEEFKQQLFSILDNASSVNEAQAVQ